MSDPQDKLNEQERVRYSRHLILPEVGSAGQERLKQSKVLVVGAGGLGSPVILYLAGAGIGTIGIADFDAVELSNLQRQVIHRTASVGQSKVESAVAGASALNPEVELKAHNLRISADNISELISQYHIVIDGTDNFATRYLVNDACVLGKKPNVYGSIYRFEGQASVFSYDNGPCYRCLYPDPPPPEAVPNCAEGGVLGVMAGVIGLIQATEAIKIIIGKGTTLSGRLLLYDALDMRFDTLNVQRDKNCPVCGENPKIKTVMESAASCSAVQANTRFDVSAVELKAMLDSGKSITLLDVRNPEEFVLGSLDNAILLPLPELNKRFSELDKNAEIVVYCKSGARGRKATEVLMSNGFTKVRNLAGGILAWAHTIDPSLSIY